MALVVTRYWRLVFLWTITLPRGRNLKSVIKKHSSKAGTAVAKCLDRRVRLELPQRSRNVFPDNLRIVGLLHLLFPTSRTLRLTFGIFAILLVVAIGFSRLCLGAHYFSDVMAGYLAATFWLVLCVAGSQAPRCISPVGKRKWAKA